MRKMKLNITELNERIQRNFQRLCEPYYQIIGDARVLALLEEMRQVFDGIDKMYIKAQTHCCLTAARSFLRLYRKTGEEKWLQSSQKVA